MGNVQGHSAFARPSSGEPASPSAAARGRGRTAPGATDFPLIDPPPWPYNEADPLTDHARRSLSEGAFNWRARKGDACRQKSQRGGAAVWMVALIGLSGAAFMIWSALAA